MTLRPCPNSDVGGRLSPVVPVVNTGVAAAAAAAAAPVTECKNNTRLERTFRPTLTPRVYTKIHAVPHERSGEGAVVSLHHSRLELVRGDHPKPGTLLAVVMLRWVGLRCFGFWFAFKQQNQNGITSKLHPALETAHRK